MSQDSTSTEPFMFHLSLPVNSVKEINGVGLWMGKGGLISLGHVADWVAVNSAGLLKGLGDLHRARNATPCTNLWPELFQVMTQSSPESQSESLFSQSVRLPRLGQIDGRFQPRDGEREREIEKWREREKPFIFMNWVWQESLIGTTALVGPF